ncbi:MAG: hypothetical protein GIW98_05765 [Candidatus Eremiobacteraeota bacterium]|nr:hypothetical protein [Candidatus Eremiobacteraeota bacterium]
MPTPTIRPDNLYLANGFQNSLTVYPLTAQGTVSPIRTVSGSNTGLNDAQGIAADKAGDVYVVNAGDTTMPYAPSVTEYLPLPSGNVGPIRTISGAAAKLALPISIAVDSAGRIYVSNFNFTGNGYVTVYSANPSGNAPIRTIPNLTNPNAVAVDAMNELFVASGAGVSGSILVYGSGNTPLRTIAGSNTLLAGPVGLAVAFIGTQESIFVMNTSAPTITSYPVTANGNVGPSKAITWSGFTGDVRNVVVDSKRGRIYATDRNHLDVFAEGSQGPSMPLWLLNSTQTGAGLLIAP